ncbi:hypothetical protein EDI_038390 [Entamoeba dispar SAW760]|uniref:Uncharacterized protein n=1 Tax=Entamoeba dispar (strain ATCC PRA-260 / SAW760) TaxID=370354 RepID=B0EKL0_ENTDS|nr:uncharacterized protein EDI_038390 [Entamoeba dispar SAW760]EDR24935.1 hypothetical protein EDI_038390 [Entamoeba dispar SAW760]|eukprot:EDR24935.1 hypothetical protein EDI_038390 [Entamoeba dispar SAW760]
MSKVTEQQTIINKAIDLIEKQIKGWSVLCQMINEGIQRFNDSNEIIEKEEQIIGLHELSERLEEMYHSMETTNNNTKNRILKLPIGNDSSVYQHYYHQCEMIEQIVKWYCIEWIIRDNLIQQLNHSISKIQIQELHDKWKNYNHNNEIQTMIDTLKTCRSFSGIVNKNLR